ncbi:kinase-like domain-containing protein [Mycena pura]|uniref:Kinase-like domain-containing protein n=1 Tax=Mycena pura TaxID=153505 RepID=A0AAD6VFG3_9AGAR|nr:kinase-like domain-containing protein [Mycena pura]
MLQPPSPRPLFATQDDYFNDSFPRASALQDILQPGDVVGEGVELQDEILCLVKLVSGVKKDTKPAREFEVVRRLGSSSGAIVYLALERSEPSRREYAIKCIRKANLDDVALKAQLDEITIHQSLHSHPNIVTLHRTLETSSFLFLILERVPGQDLFYFIEEARDFFEPPASAYSLAVLTSPQLLSRARLSLISSMFSQMCDAVAACHAQQVFHRDIKPENFIVNEDFTEVDGRVQRNVIVKLTDFGLSTTDVESSDMDCGSTPYMSYECRNNIAPSYRPRAADVWSLGVSLIKMIYHCNPWTDTKVGECQSFDLFRQQPVTFFMERFVGMTRPVAEHLAYKVFNILDDPTDDSQRISAADFSLWVKDLPDLLGNHSPDSTASNTAWTIQNPTNRSRSISPARSFGPALEETSNKPEASRLPPVIDRFVVEQGESRTFQDILDTFGMENDSETSTDSESHSASITKRRHRGHRKGMGSQPPQTPRDDTAIASQTLAREISREYGLRRQLLTRNVHVLITRHVRVHYAY